VNNRPPFNAALKDINWPSEILGKVHDWGHGEQRMERDDGATILDDDHEGHCCVNLGGIARGGSSRSRPFVSVQASPLSS
jgi:hypothetical protein